MADDPDRIYTASAAAPAATARLQALLCGNALPVAGSALDVERIDRWRDGACSGADIQAPR